MSEQRPIPGEVWRDHRTRKLWCMESDGQNVIEVGTQVRWWAPDDWRGWSRVLTADCKIAPEVRRALRIEGADLGFEHAHNHDAENLDAEDAVDARWPEDAPK